LGGFFALVARVGVWRLPGLFVAAGASDCGEDRFTFSAVFVFFGTGVQWLMTSTRYRSSAHSQVLSRPVYEIA
jgi:hypothetical protein